MLDHYIEAEYESGYIHSSRIQDVSPYTKCEKVDGVTTGANILSDIVNKRPEEFHGKMVRFSAVLPDKQYDIDWTKLDDSARPIFTKQMEADVVGGEVVEVRITGMQFGYQYNDSTGKNHKQIKDIK